jgi:hypothetical protein
MTRASIAASALVVGIVGAACGSPAEPTAIADHLRPGRVLVVGETHGTEQFPAAVLEAVEAVDDRHVPVRLGLEIPRDEAARFARYLRSHGTRADRRALLAGSFWETPDGRASEAMLGLVEGVRARKASGYDVDIFVFDAGRKRDEAAADRDESMANRIAETVRKTDDAVHIVLVGDFHAGRVPTKTSDGKRFVPMAAYLGEGLDDLLTLESKHAGGRMWGCLGNVPGCGVRDVRGEELRLREPSVLLGQGGRGYDGALYVGTITASPPAREASR